MEDKIPTAEEWLTSFGADSDDMFYKHSVEEAMIKFAKLIVVKTLNELKQVYESLPKLEMANAEVIALKDKLKATLK